MHQQVQEPVKVTQPKHGRLLYLLFTVLLLIIFQSFLEESMHGKYLLAVLMTAIPAASIATMSSNKRYFRIGSFVGIPFILFNWIATINPSAMTKYLALLFGIGFYLYTIIVLISYLLRARKITLEMIYGSISAYLLIGILFATAYTTIELAEPGSFIMDNNPTTETGFFYYSYVTITTLGYGDITPVSGLAKTLSILEAISGVFFIAIFIARKIGIYMIQKDASIKPH